MPSRIVREGILTSTAVDQLTSGGEIFYRRVLNIVDDFGRYHGTPALLRAAAFPLKIDKVLDKHIEQWLAECVKAGLIEVYTHNGLPYIEVLKFGSPRAKASKFVRLKADENKCLQTQTDANNRTVVVVESVVVSDKLPLPDSDESVDEPERESTPAQERFDEFWELYPRKTGKGKAWAAFKRLKADDQASAVEQAEAYGQAYKMAPEARRQYFKHPTTWINARGWEDDHAEWQLLIEGK